mmetsp:Transcript_40538/g.134144  ORF Transcript_40538/g.134144 Transcript_40538/m.134144 type:complete len:205 (+) Transcript_40538:470-1084(+)
MAVEHAAEDGDRDAGELRGQVRRVRGRPEQKPAREDEAGLGMPDHLEGDCRRAADEAERGDVRPKGDEAGQHHQRQCARAAAPVAAAAVRGLLGEPDRRPALSGLLRTECGRQTCAEVLQRNRRRERLRHLPGRHGRLQLRRGQLELLLLGALPDLEDCGGGDGEQAEDEAGRIELHLRAEYTRHQRAEDDIAQRTQGTEDASL